MRISYSKDHRKKARTDKKGLFTVSLTNEDGDTISVQGVVSDKEAKDELDRSTKMVLTVTKTRKGKE